MDKDVQSARWGKLIEEMKKMGYEDATGKQQEAFWQQMVKDHAEGRDIKDRETRKMIKNS